MFEANVTAMWDPKARVWVGTSEEVPGLVLETESLDVMLLRVREMVPELLEMNNLAHLAHEGIFVRLHTTDVEHATA